MSTNEAQAETILRLERELALSQARVRRAVSRCVQLRSKLQRATHLARLFKSLLRTVNSVMKMRQSDSHRGGIYGRELREQLIAEREVFLRTLKTLESALHVPVCLLMTEQTREFLRRKLQAADSGDILSSYQIVTRSSLEQCMDYMLAGDNRSVTQLVIQGAVPAELIQHPWFKRKRDYELLELRHLATNTKLAGNYG